MVKGMRRERRSKPANETRPYQLLQTWNFKSQSESLLYLSVNEKTCISDTDARRNGEFSSPYRLCDRGPNKRMSGPVSCSST